MAGRVLEIKNTFIFEREYCEVSRPSLARSYSYPCSGGRLKSLFVSLEDLAIPQKSTPDSVDISVWDNEADDAVEDQILSPPHSEHTTLSPHRAVCRLSSLTTDFSDNGADRSADDNSKTNTNASTSPSNDDNSNSKSKSNAGHSSQKQSASTSPTPNSDLHPIGVRPCQSLLRLRTFDAWEDDDRYLPREEEEACAPPSSQASSTNPGTTLMLRNIPRCFHRDMLVDLLEKEGFGSDYDFLYFPYKFEVGSPEGYAFVNGVTQEATDRMAAHFANFNNWGVPGSKKCTVGWSRAAMGLKANVFRYRNSPVMHKSVPEHWRPLRRSGGVTIPFEPPTKTIKPPRKGTKRVRLESA